MFWRREERRSVVESDAGAERGMHIEWVPRVAVWQRGGAFQAGRLDKAAVWVEVLRPRHRPSRARHVSNSTKTVKGASRERPTCKSSAQLQRVGSQRHPVRSRGRAAAAPAAAGAEVGFEPTRCTIQWRLALEARRSSLKPSTSTRRCASSVRQGTWRALLTVRMLRRHWLPRWRR